MEDAGEKTLPLILVASATANTGAHAIRELAASGKCRIRAFARKVDDQRLAFIEKEGLKDVEIVAGDFDDLKTVAEALKGVSRAILVTSPFVDELYDRETNFIIEAKKAGCEGVVRVSTASPLMSAGTKCHYARHHYGIEAFAAGDMPGGESYPVINVHPNWFYTNLSWFFGVMIKATKGKIMWPAAANNPVPFAAVDTRDVGSALAACALCDGVYFQKMIQSAHVEIHGKELTTWGGMADALTESTGMDIQIVTVSDEQWIAIMVDDGKGLPYKYSLSMCSTIKTMGGDVCVQMPSTSSAIMAAIGWQPKYGVKDWANLEETKTMCSYEKEEEVEAAAEAGETAEPEVETKDTEADYDMSEQGTPQFSVAAEAEASAEKAAMGGGEITEPTE